MPGGTEWIVVGAVVLLLFGAKKLPELARSLGKSSREFKRGLQEGEPEQRAEQAPAPTPETKTPED
jgi:sec-independent protein translocase protein TatA